MNNTVHIQIKIKDKKDFNKCISKIQKRLSKLLQKHLIAKQIKG